MIDNLFEDIEDPEKADQKISFAEKTVILAGYSFARFILRKLRRANTYGDIQKLTWVIEESIEETEANDSFKNPKEKFNSFLNTVKSKL